MELEPLDGGRVSKQVREEVWVDGAGANDPQADRASSTDESGLSLANAPDVPRSSNTSSGKKDIPRLQTVPPELLRLHLRDFRKNRMFDSSLPNRFRRNYRDTFVHVVIRMELRAKRSGLQLDESSVA